MNMPRAENKCSICGKCVSRKNDLPRHERTHDPDARRLPCAYPGCEYRCLQKSNLRTHYAAKHLRLKANKCTIDDCTKAFGDPSALIRHEKVVHKVRRPKNGTKNQRGGFFVMEESTYIKAVPNAEPSTPSLPDSRSMTPPPLLSYLKPNPFDPPVASGSNQTQLDSGAAEAVQVTMPLELPTEPANPSTEASDDSISNQSEGSEGNLPYVGFSHSRPFDVSTGSYPAQDCADSAPLTNGYTSWASGEQLPVNQEASQAFPMPTVEGHTLNTYFQQPWQTNSSYV